MKNTHSIDELKVGEVWMCKQGTRIQITSFPELKHDDPFFFARWAGTGCETAFWCKELDYKISK